MRASEASEASGFIHSVTSQTETVEVTEELNLKRRLRGMKCGTITGARLHQQEATQGGRRVHAAFVTLTYAQTGTWSPRHISSYLDALKKHLKRRGIRLRYVWTLELQKRGAPHYHVLVWLPLKSKIPKPDLCGWWPHGLSNIQRARNAVAYIAKYASKGGTYEFQIPRGARIHATGGLDSAGAIERRWWLSPRWVRSAFPTICDLFRPEGGGFINRQTGEFCASPWMVCRINGAICLIKME